MYSRCKYCRLSKKNKNKWSTRQHGGGISKSLLKFVTENLSDIQRAARERNDRPLKISSELIQSVIELGKKEETFKKNLKHLSNDNKIKQERDLKVELNKLKMFNDWENLEKIKNIFYDSVSGVDSQWIVENYINGNINRVEDITSRLKPAVEEFRSLQKQGILDKTLKIEKLNGLDDLESFLEDYAEDLGKTKKRKVDSDDLELIFEGKSIKIYHPKTQQAACYIGQGTRWCTASTKGQNMFDYYNQDGPLYVIQPIKGRDREKYQLHFETLQLMDEKDEAVDMNALLSKYPELFNAFPVLNNKTYRELFVPNGVVKFVFLRQDLFENMVAVIDPDEGNIALYDDSTNYEWSFKYRIRGNIIVTLGHLPDIMIKALIQLVEDKGIEDFEGAIRDSDIFKNWVKQILKEN